MRGFSEHSCFLVSYDLQTVNIIANPHGPGAATADEKCIQLFFNGKMHLIYNPLARVPYTYQWENDPTQYTGINQLKIVFDYDIEQLNRITGLSLE